MMMMVVVVVMITVSLSPLRTSKKHQNLEVLEISQHAQVEKHKASTNGKSAQAGTIIMPSIVPIA